MRFKNGLEALRAGSYGFAMDISAFLISLGLEEYDGRFRANDIDGSVLVDLTDADLQTLGVQSLGHRRKLLKAIAARQPGPEGSAAKTQAVPSPAAAPRSRPERRHLTVMFCDLVGSTALSARLDPEDLRDVISAYHSTCANVIRNHDGFVAKIMGDGVLAYFGYPHAQEDDAERAVRAGLAMIAAVGAITTPHAPALQMRIGIATGHVVVGDLIGEGTAQEWSVVGDTPNVAARLQALAQSGSLVVARSTRNLLGSLFRLRALGSHEIKGLDEPVDIWSVEGAHTGRTRFEARTGVLTAFFGRAEERSALRHYQSFAWSGRGQAVVISGEAGIGKSRLVAWLVEKLADAPHRILAYQCSRHHADSPLHPFVMELAAEAGIEGGDPAATKLDKLESSLRTRLPAITDHAALFAELLAIPAGKRYPASESGPAERRRKTLDALLDIITADASATPVLVVFEDAHWTDATSRELLGRLIERIRTMPVLLLVTTRPEFSLRWPHAGNLNTLVLERLDAWQVRSMIAQMTRDDPISADIVDGIIAKTDGIPLFAEELTKTVLESGVLTTRSHNDGLLASLGPLAIPATLQDSLMARLDRLDTVKDVVQIGAAIGREFTRSLVATVSDLRDAEVAAALDSLEKAELVSRRGLSNNAVYTFKHALIQDAAYASLLKSRRHVIHRDIADAIVADLPSLASSEPETVARHFTEAGLPDKALEWWTKAGESASSRSAYEEAAGHFSKAVAQYEARSGAPDLLPRLRLQVSLGQALVSARGFAAPETVEAFEKALQLADSITDVSERFTVYYGLYMNSVTSGTGASLYTWANKFLDLAKMRPDSPEFGIGHRLVGATDFFEGNYASSREHLETAVAVCDADPDLKIAMRYQVSQRATSKVNLAMALAPIGERSRGLQLADQSVEEALATKHLPSIALVMGHRFVFDAISADLPRCRRTVAEMRGFYITFKVPLWQAWIDLFAGWTDFQLGEREEGMRQTRSALAFFRGQGLGRFLPISQLMFVEAEALTNVEAAQALLEQQIAALEDAGERWFHAELHRHRGELFLRRAQPDIAAAEQAMEQAREIARVQGARTFEMRAAMSLANLYARTDRREDARHGLAASIRKINDPALDEAAAVERLLAELAG